MSFLSEFSTFFTPEERNTELYRMWSAIGVNMEKAILEEQNRLNSETTDLSYLSENLYRSWLSFFLAKIPYRTSARCFVTTTISSSVGTITIPKYTPLVSRTGKTYLTLTEQSIQTPGSMVVEAIQGKVKSETGTYSSIIKVQISNPDLDTLEVKIRNNKIPEVSYMTSYDQVRFLGFIDTANPPVISDLVGTRGEWYIVHGDTDISVIVEGSTRRTLEVSDGDIILYDGSKWMNSVYVSSIYSIQNANSFAIPRNGYFAYYQDGYLYIKVFTGNLVSNPDGGNYEVTVVQSDGTDGRTGQNTLDYTEKVFGNSGDLTSVMGVSNTASTGALDEPARGKLGLMVKQRLYSQVNISSIPEYTAWFKAQPEIGDCLVMGDYERWVRGGKKDWIATGSVIVHAVDPDGNDISGNTTITTLLDERIEPYKDLGRIIYAPVSQVEHVLSFTYTSSTDDTVFETEVRNRASQWYDIEFLMGTTTSKFEDLDLSMVLSDVLAHVTVQNTGLMLKGYHYYYEETGSGYQDFPNLTLPAGEPYLGEEMGDGKYIVTFTDSNDTDVTVEVSDTPNGKIVYYGAGSVNEVGTRTESGIYLYTLNLKNAAGLNVTKWKSVECRWGMKDEGLLTVGLVDGIRNLHSVEVRRV